jgi:hypothetical protein
MRVENFYWWMCFWILTICTQNLRIRINLLFVARNKACYHFLKFAKTILNVLVILHPAKMYMHIFIYAFTLNWNMCVRACVEQGRLHVCLSFFVMLIPPWGILREKLTASQLVKTSSYFMESEGFYHIHKSPPPISILKA